MPYRARCHLTSSPMQRLQQGNITIKSWEVQNRPLSRPGAVPSCPLSLPPPPCCPRWDVSHLSVQRNHSWIKHELLALIAALRLMVPQIRLVLMEHRLTFGCHFHFLLILLWPCLSVLQVWSYWAMKTGMWMARRIMEVSRLSCLWLRILENYSHSSRVLIEGLIRLDCILYPIQCSGEKEADIGVYVFYSYTR